MENWDEMKVSSLSAGQVENALEVARCKEIIMEWESKFSPGKIFDFMNVIVENLYLGDRSAAIDLDLADKGFKYVLNAAQSAVRTHATFYGDKITFKGLELMDDEEFNIEPYFDDSYQFIDTALSKGEKILVHCSAGASRSATLVIAYLMKKYNLRLEPTLEYVQRQRPIVQPNLGFMASLEKLDKKLAEK
eukprot:TRINITY_DN16197_c0_g1_i1.p2 TRINITY_DN16197_c0_g1~~TRINITY_DN16197_c0_g1_i1.p2  ORF type:complete len:191 (+),score=69.51 TRINITY_DN16197_c0_g1_i1:1329-1901(+)